MATGRWSYLDAKLGVEASVVCVACGEIAPEEVARPLQMLRMIYRELKVRAWPNVPQLWCSDHCRRLLLARGGEEAQGPLDLVPGELMLVPEDRPPHTQVFINVYTGENALATFPDPAKENR